MHTLTFHKCKTGVNDQFWIGFDPEIVRRNQILGRSLATSNTIQGQHVFDVKIRNDFAGA